MLLKSVGALVGATLALWVTGFPQNPVLLASIGGTSVFVFGAPAADAAQPRAVILAHIGCSVIGLCAAKLLPVHAVTGALTITLSLLWMLGSRALHPPAAANPLIILHGDFGAMFLFYPCAVAVLVVLGVAVAWNRWVGRQPYPRVWWNEKTDVPRPRDAAR